MDSKLFRLFPFEPTGCLIKIKNIVCFEKEVDIKHFFEHLVEICLVYADYKENEAYALLHSKEEVFHFMKFHYMILKNMIFIDLERNNIEIEILNKEEEKAFWSQAEKLKAKFYICCNVHNDIIQCRKEGICKIKINKTNKLKQII